MLRVERRYFMKERVLVILEVSQKQAYIFSSNKLKDNIVNSSVIAWIMSGAYFEETAGNKQIFSEAKNMVYSGGGHTVLEFESCEKAREFVMLLTKQIHQDYEGIQVFASIMKYDNKLSPSKNLKNLTAKLEYKKSIRKSAFHQGSYGIEKIDTNTLEPVRVLETDKQAMPKQEEVQDKALCPKGFERTFRFEELGGSKNDTNFIAVVHIDGNAMGKRVEKFYQTYDHLNWEDFKIKVRKFSASIDKDFKQSYLEMADHVADIVRKNGLEQLNLSSGKLPIRRIITAGDDICFVSEGRIGVECAALFLKKLSAKINEEDHLPYSACAGVAIVHQKYPFFKAYELSELLCSNAKKFGASLSSDGTGADVCAIDWHVEFGEVKDTLDDIRKEYRTKDGWNLELRPYLVSTTKKIEQEEPFRQYEKFRKLLTRIQKQEINHARGKLKELRGVLKQGEDATEYFLKFNKIESLKMMCYQDIFVELQTDRIATGQGLDAKIFVKTKDEKMRSLLFDTIEMLDTFLPLEDKGGRP